MPQNKVPAAPKFGSFRPRTTKHLPEVSSRIRDADQRHDDDKVDQPPTSSSKDSGRTLKSRGKPKHTSTRDQAVEESSVSHSADTFFMVDIRGDAKNVQFDSPHQYDIPRYHRFGGGHVIGAPTHARIDREQSTDKVVVLGTNGQSQGQRRPLLTRANTGHEPSRLKPSFDNQDRDSPVVLQDDEIKMEQGSDSRSASAGAGIWAFIEDGA